MKRSIRITSVALACALILTILAPIPEAWPAAIAAPAPRPAALPRIEAQRVEQVGRSGGLVAAGIPLPDGSLLMGEGPALVHLAPFDSAPRILSRTDLGRGIILDMMQAEALICVLTEEGLSVLTAAGDGSWQEASFIPGSGQALDVRGALVAVAAREAGLRLLTLDEGGLVETAAVLPLDGTALDVALALDGREVYVAAGEAGLHIVSAVDPASPVLLRTLTGAAGYEAVGMAGPLLAAAAGEGRVMLTDPARTAGGPVGVYAALRQGRRLVLQGEYAYIADARDGLKILRLLAPGRAVQVFGEVDRPALDLWVEAGYVYLVGPGGLRILNVSDHSRPLEIGQLPLSGLPQDIVLTPGRAFIALGDAGLAVVSIENLAAPRLTRRILLQEAAHAVHFDGRTVFVAAGEAGLVLVDASLPGAETLRDTLPLPGPALDILQQGTALYVAAGEAGLLGIDLSRPARPVLAGVLSPGPDQRYLSLTGAGKRAYVTGGDGFIVADISSPYRMGRLAQVETTADHAALQGTTLYVLGGSQLGIFDVRATADPVLLGTVTGLGHAVRITAHNDRLFVSGGGGGPGLVVLDIQHPDRPVEVGSSASLEPAWRASIQGQDVWLARGYAGLDHFTLDRSGALTERRGYSSLPDAGHLWQAGDVLLAGGRGGWSWLELEDGALPAWPPAVQVDLTVRDLALHGDTAAVAAGNAGVALYRRGQPPEAPSLVARRETRGPAVGVALDESFVYAADAEGLSIYDRRYLLPVTQVRTPAPASSITIHSGLAYLPLADGRLALITLADPTGGLRLRSSLSAGRPTTLIRSADGLALYGLSDDRVFRLDASDPDRLVVQAAGQLPSLAAGGFFVNELLWAITPGEAARLYDVRFLRTENPTLRGEIETSAQALLVSGTLVYAAHGEDGLGMFDLARPEAEVFLSTEPVYALQRQRDTLLALGDTIAAWDITAPGQPRLLDTLPLFGRGNHIAAGEQDLLLLSLESGLALVRWDGEAFSPAGHLFTPGGVDRAEQVGDRAYLALHRGGLLVADITSPAQPSALFSTASASGRFVHDLLALDNQTLLVSWEGGLDVLDVGTAGPAPHLLDVISLGGSTALSLSLSADGRLGAAAMGESGVTLLDLSQPERPEIAGYVDTPGEALRAAVAGQILVVADGLCGLRVIDISTLNAPREQGYWRGGYASDVAVGPDGLVYLADSSQLLALRYDPAAPAVLPPMPQRAVPSDGQDGVPLTLSLGWGPEPDPCQPLTYQVYLGLDDNPPFIGQVDYEPSLQVGELEPLRTYRWWVQATDRQGDTIQGPVWRFTTTAADYADQLPPAPPPFIERLPQHPVLPAIVLTLVVLLTALSWLNHRRRQQEKHSQHRASGRRKSNEI